MNSKLGLRGFVRFFENAPIRSHFKTHMILSVIEAGEKIKSISRVAKVKSGEGHRSIVTKADVISNDHILKSLPLFLYPHARFVCEEGSRDQRVLPRDRPDGILDSEYAAVIDSLDGTSRFAGSYPDWCVAAGSLSKGWIDGSVITAPDARGGTICFSHKALGTFFSEGFSFPKKVPVLSENLVTESVILRGVDTELYANVLGIMPQVASCVRAVYTEGSGLFALMSVTLGRAAAVIQTPQKAWDWVPAYHALRDVGGVFRFFRLNDGNLIPVETYDFDAFTYKKENRLGFVAGEPTMADRLFEQLPKTGWERYDPDTVGANDDVHESLSK